MLHHAAADEYNDLQEWRAGGYHLPVEAIFCEQASDLYSTKLVNFTRYSALFICFASARTN